MLLRSSKLTLAVLTSFAIGITANSVALAGSSTLKPKSSELSPSVLGMEESSHGYEPGDEKAKKPGEFDLGGNTLHIDADKKDPTPPVGFESNGQAVLNKAPSEHALQPSYLGLRLTTPITTPGK